MDEEFLVRRGMPKGAMSLIDEATARSLRDDMGATIGSSGGSAANTIAGIASLGGSAAFVGKVRDDALGQTFAEDIRRLGVHFTTPFATSGPATAQCLILVTEDAERTMNTFLGACVELTPDDIDADTIRDSAVTYLEGYLWDPEGGKAAFRKAVDIAHAAGRKVALTLSDPFCVERYRQEFQAFIEHGVDILFANEDEIVSLFEARDFDDALQHARDKCEIACLTRSEKGSVVLSGDEIHVIDADTGIEVVDTTGAGDLYAAGMLYGLARGRDLHDCGQLATRCASIVIGQFGARPDTSLATLLNGN